jgi:hypothetical protein
MRARLATNQFSRNLTTAMHLLFLLPTRFFFGRANHGQEALHLVQLGPTPIQTSAREMVCFASGTASRLAFLTRKGRLVLLFLFLHYTLFPQECRSSDLFDGWIASLLFVAIVYGYLGRMLLPCGNNPKGMLAFRIQFKYIIKKLSPALHSCCAVMCYQND